MNDYDPVLHALEADWQRQHEAVRQMLYDKGRPDLVADLDHKIREVRNGVAFARSAWHSISEAQREALRYAAENGGRLVLRPIGTSDQYRAERGPRSSRPIRKPTMRNLCSRELMAWDGGAFDPEGAAVITERGLFVLKRGPV